ncbi:hypothetical protein NKR23_g8176 [Pleurostoma richardsiae]|uniref:Uncharacterized protein n=1 Tax=Pleurostoma richardsiae TaxID=41990 RepID=A0AA38VLF6_9PEZI|nr:hypothetical protein NKR23_g8176 [Pleurostoma richardsiae]
MNDYSTPRFPGGTGKTIAVANPKHAPKTTKLSGGIMGGSTINPAATNAPRIVDSLDDVLGSSVGDSTQHGAEPPVTIGGSRRKAQAGHGATADAGLGRRSGGDAGVGSSNRTGGESVEVPGLKRTALFSPYHHTPDDDVAAMKKTYRELSDEGPRPRSLEAIKGTEPPRCVRKASARRQAQVSDKTPPRRSAKRHVQTTAQISLQEELFFVDLVRYVRSFLQRIIEAQSRTSLPSLHQTMEYR